MSGATDVPFGKKGIIYSGAGRHTWKEIAQRAADAAMKAGKISGNEVRSVGIKEGADAFAGGNDSFVELGFASNSRTKGDVARALGWKPEKGQEDWEAHFDEVIQTLTA